TPPAEEPVSRLLHLTLSLFAAAFLIGSTCGGSRAVITILTPAHGTFTTAPNVTITGTVNNGHSGLQILVNGNVADYDVAAGTWSITLPLDSSKIINAFTASALRTSDNVVVSRDRIVV